MKFENFVGGIQPEAANNNEAPQNNENIERIEQIKEAQEVYAELKRFDGNLNLTREEYEQAAELANRLSELLEGFTWKECADNGLPWSPRSELEKTAA